MATREFLPLLQQARHGDVQAQLELGKAYLSGDMGLTKNASTALFWLQLAARQGLAVAQHLIGKHIPLSAAQHSVYQADALDCYRIVGKGGNDLARWQYALWCLEENSPAKTKDHKLAIRWLRLLANKKFSPAAWRLSQWLHEHPLEEKIRHEALIFAQQAAQAGETEAIRWLAQQSWQSELVNDRSGNLALPAAMPGLQRLTESLLNQAELTQDDARLLLIHAQDLMDETNRNLLEKTERNIGNILERAASTELPEAQYRYGLWLGQIDIGGHRLLPGRLKKALPWLERARTQGHTQAMFVLAELYRNPRFSGHNIKQSNERFAQAARLGHAQAQYNLGKILWRQRDGSIKQAIEATYWLWRAANGQVHEASTRLRELMPRTDTRYSKRWEMLANYVECTKLNDVDTLMGQRILVANAFGLDLPELLWVDLVKAPPIHCLVVDISQHRPGRRPRLILIETVKQRQVLISALQVFKKNEQIQALEGTEQQREYRLKLLTGIAKIKAQKSVKESLPI